MIHNLNNILPRGKTFAFCIGLVKPSSYAFLRKNRRITDPNESVKLKSQCTIESLLSQIIQQRPLMFQILQALGLNQHHQSVILSYIKFSKYMRSQNLKQIQQPFQEIESRLFDDTYTKEEVKELVADLEKIVLCDVESELISFAHNNVLMLKQLFKQAEKWYLRLEIDMSELQNQEELEQIKLLESGETPPEIKLKSENSEFSEEGSAALLKLEIERLKEENEKLSKIIQDAEDVADLYKQEKNKLGDKLLNAQKEIGNYKALLENSSAPRNDFETIKQMEAKLNEIENLLSVNAENLEQNENIKDKLKMELTSTKEKVKQIEAQLQLAEAELEKKFSETKAYANMKQILIKKNEKIKELRQKILKYEPEVKEDEDTEE